MPAAAALLLVPLAACGGGGGSGDSPFTASPIRGTVFLDANRNGIQDAGEPGIPGLSVRLLGIFGALDRTVTSDANGIFGDSNVPGGSFLIDVLEEPGFYPTFGTLEAVLDPNPGVPEIADRRTRSGNTRDLLDRAAAATSSNPLLHVSLGDSVGFGTNACGSENGTFGYGQPFTSRLDLAVRSAAWQQLAVPGFRTSDLLRRPPNCPVNPNGECPKQQPPPGFCCGTIYYAASFQPDVVTISIMGNDVNPFLNGQDEAGAALAVARARQNLQEILSGLQALVPGGVQIVLNTIYDNRQGTEAFRNRWLPVGDQMLRDVALGQQRPAVISEVHAEYAHLDPVSQFILGEQNLICAGTSEPDGIHPNNVGYLVHVEKLWDGIGGTDNAGGALVNLHFGLLQHIETRFPTQPQDLGLGVANPTDALALDGKGALMTPTAGELRLTGFDATANGMLVYAKVGVAYRTTAPPAVDDAYRFEASADGTFAAPGTTLTTWNTILPIVGGAGDDGAPILAVPDVPSTYRTVTATLTTGAPSDGSPSFTWSDLQNLSVRFEGLPGPFGPASYQVDWDAAWVELYGIPPNQVIWEGNPRPGGKVTIHVTGREGDPVQLDVAEALARAPLAVPPYEGEARLDPARILRSVHGRIGTEGVFDWILEVPEDGSLSGKTLYVQALVKSWDGSPGGDGAGRFPGGEEAGSAPGGAGAAPPRAGVVTPVATLALP